MKVNALKPMNYGDVNQVQKNAIHSAKIKASKGNTSFL